MRLAFRSSRAVHALLAAAVVALLMAIEPAPARASGGGLALGFDTDDTFAAALIATNIAVFGTLDTVFIAIDRPLPVGISILQIGVGGLLIPIVAGASSSWTAVHVGAYASAFWFTLHGIHDLAIYPEYRKRRLREREREGELEGERRRNEVDPPCAPERTPEPIYGVSVAPSALGDVTLQLYVRL